MPQLANFQETASEIILSGRKVIVIAISNVRACLVQHQYTVEMGNTWKKLAFCHPKLD